MPISILAALVAVPLIAAFFLFVLLPRLADEEDRSRRSKRR
jgi:hypothetical protein